jgi:hypothetical protein
VASSFWHRQPSEPLVPVGRDVGVVAGQTVAVDVQRHRHLGMAEALAHRHDALAGAQGAGGGRVAQAMEGYARHVD